jgi:hypothetical protein
MAGVRQAAGAQLAETHTTQGARTDQSIIGIAFPAKKYMLGRIYRPLFDQMQRDVKRGTAKRPLLLSIVTRRRYLPYIGPRGAANMPWECHMSALRNKPPSGRPLLWSVLIAGLLVATPSRAQTTSASSQREDSALTGTVVSSTRDTLVVRGENGQFQLFVFDRDSLKPRTLPVGSRVRVVSTLGEEPGVRVASEITLDTAPAAPQSTATQPGQPIPPEVRRIERQIERQVRRYQAGVRAGVALDPELVLVGVHAQVGPFFNPNIYLRPNVEFAYGEVTALFALNMEAIYRLPVSARQGRWSTYFGIGPGFSFLHQNFERTAGGGRKIDFGDFHSDVGLNILGGMRYRSGMFLELKTSVYSRPAPTLRLIVGYNF